MAQAAEPKTRNQSPISCNRQNKKKVDRFSVKSRQIFQFFFFFLQNFQELEKKKTVFFLGSRLRAKQKNCQVIKMSCFSLGAVKERASSLLSPLCYGRAILHPQLFCVISINDDDCLSLSLGQYYTACCRKIELMW